MDPTEEHDHIAELEQRLYARDPESVPERTFGILRPIRQNVTSAWGQTSVPQEKAKRKSGVSGYRKFFIFSLIFFLLALGVAVYSIYRGALTLSSKNVDVSILGNSFIGAGETLPIQVEVANSNSADLLDAKLSVDYPEGASDGTGSDTAHVEQDLGTIGAGKTKSQAFSVILYGQQGQSQTITTTLTYSLKDSSATFQQQKTFAVMISSSPITLTVDGPTAIAANQPFELTIDNTFTSTTPLSNVVARVDYPSGFVFNSSVPAPDGGNNVWLLGDLETGTDRTITIQGKLLGDENEQKSFRVYVGTPVSANDSTIATTYNSGLHTVTLSEPFIAAQLNLNNQTTDVASVPVGDNIDGSVSWTNNSAQTITNPTFTLALDGTAVDTSTVAATNGYYDASSDTITWTADSDPGIASIAPGQSGELNFTFSPTANDSSDIGLQLSVQGTFPANNYQQQSITDIDSKTIRFSSHVQFASQAFYSVGPIKNTGPFPPQQGQATTYTVTWTAQPSENPLTDVVATAVLPQGVDWTGIVSPQSAPVTYDPDTQTVTWDVGVLPKASSTPVLNTVSFQVSAKPTADQVGQTLSLLGPTTVTATDSVANVPITVTRPALTTELASDPVYSVGKERVVQ
jgi:hypothetical protein